jgi:hypothetical protein
MKEKHIKRVQYSAEEREDLTVRAMNLLQARQKPTKCRG